MVGRDDRSHAEAVRRTLEARARALAEPARPEGPVDRMRAIVVAVGQERYGVSIDHAREIRHLDGLTPLPGVPSFWAGLVNLRGQLFPVLDLGRYLGLQSQDVSKRSLLLVSAAGVDVAVLVDGVVEVREVPQHAVASLMADHKTACSKAVKGVTADLLTVLDLDTLLADPRLVVYEAGVLAGGGTEEAVLGSERKGLVG